MLYTPGQLNCTRLSSGMCSKIPCDFANSVQCCNKTISRRNQYIFFETIVSREGSCCFTTSLFCNHVIYPIAMTPGDTLLLCPPLEPLLEISQQLLLWKVQIGKFGIQHCKDAPNRLSVCKYLSCSALLASNMRKYNANGRNSEIR